ncbi:MAG: DUF72 domain-containing protein [Chloroflexia bacterium]|nr:DUF72 domain-containing protein [Chloroflexia bacterium]
MTGREARPGNIRIGISSWGSLPGFYPSGVKPADKLPWFARYFSVVEVNVSFYRLVAPHTYAHWAEITPSNFVFDVKAFGELTHFRDPPPGATFAAFRDSYQPLRDDGRLGGVLHQFPPRFANTLTSQEHLRRVAEQMHGDPTVIEFRNHTWLAPDQAEATFALLKELGLGYAIADEPQIPNDTVPPLLAVTNPALAYIRLHGRNADAWYRGGSGGTRYDYDYSATELEEWAAVATDLAAQARDVHVLFNNNAQGAGTRNALALGELLGIAPLDPPELPPAQPPLFTD